MKKLLIFLFIMVPILTIAKGDKGTVFSKPVQCFSTEILLYSIDVEFKESVVFFYPNEITKGKSEIVMFSNKENGTWTLIEIFKENSCVLAVGSAPTT